MQLKIFINRLVCEGGTAETDSMIAVKEEVFGRLEAC
jgi:hypothetical protein